MQPGSALPWTCAALGVGLALACVHLSDLSGRVHVLEGRPSQDPERVLELEARARELEQSLARAETAMTELSRSAARQRDVAAGLRELQAGLQEAACRIEEQRAYLARVRDLEEQVGPQAIDKRFEQFGASVDERWREINALAANAEKLAASAHAGLQTVEREIAHDPDTMWNDLLGPTVQVSGEETVGTGVLIAAPASEGAGRGTYVLTAWHVVRDLFAGKDDESAPIPVTLYFRESPPRTETAELLEHDADLDAALLLLPSSVPVSATARLASRERLSGVRVFDRVYAVGCPLGNDPIPTFGEVADVHHLVDGQRYWMVSAPTYIGNSGGGIFDADTRELIGLFTKIYTHGSVRPAVVPHMGLAMPLSSVYDWLDHVGHAGLEPQRAEGRAKPQTASASK